MMLKATSTSCKRSIREQDEKKLREALLFADTCVNVEKVVEEKSIILDKLIVIAHFSLRLYCLMHWGKPQDDVESNVNVMQEMHSWAWWEETKRDASILLCLWIGRITKWRIRWSLIAKRVPGRTDNQEKNYWNTHLRKKLGVKDPKTKLSSVRSVHQISQSVTQILLEH